MAEAVAVPAPRVPRGQLFFARLMRATAGFWERLGNLETRVLGAELSKREIHSPIYVTGLARAGTTIVTEMLASHPDVTSHHYSDFPPVWTPYWWNALRDRLPLPEPQPEERAHRDRLAVTPDSPEAVEEVLWMHFFPHVHDPAENHVLGPETVNERFERFYRDHVRKLLAVRGRSRYLAKGNYNLTRLGYIRRLFPDARFVIVMRDPAWHIASLMKQDRLFTEQHRQNPKVTEYLKLLGHFEFGVHKRPINAGDAIVVKAIMSAWREGGAVAGWARYWGMLHRFIAEQLRRESSLARAALIVPYEFLCEDSGRWIDRIIEHCGLPTGPFAAARATYADRLTPPDYYAPDFTSDEQRLIESETRSAYETLLSLTQER